MILLLCVNYTVQSRCVTVFVCFEYSTVTVCYCYCVLNIQYSHVVLLLLSVNYTAQLRCVTVILSFDNISHYHGGAAIFSLVDKTMVIMVNISAIYTIRQRGS